MRSDEDYDEQFESLHEANTEITRRETKLALHARLVGRERSFLAKARSARAEKAKRARAEVEHKDRIASPTEPARDSSCTSPSVQPALHDTHGHGRGNIERAQ